MTVFNTSATVVFLLCEVSPKCKKKEKIIKFRELFFPTTFVLVPATGTFQVCNELFYGLDQL